VTREEREKDNRLRQQCKGTKRSGAAQRDPNDHGQATGSRGHTALPIATQASQPASNAKRTILGTVIGGDETESLVAEELDFASARHGRSNAFVERKVVNEVTCCLLVLLCLLLLLLLRRWDCKPQRSRGAQRSSCLGVRGRLLCLVLGGSGRFTRYTDAVRSLRWPASEVSRTHCVQSWFEANGKWGAKVAQVVVPRLGV